MLTIKTRTVVAAWVLMVAALAAIVLLEGWLFMLTMGAAHSIWPTIPAWGFWASIAWMILLWLIIRFVSMAWKGFVS